MRIDSRTPGAHHERFPPALPTEGRGPVRPSEQARLALALAAGKGAGAAGRFLHVRRRDQLSRGRCPAGSTRACCRKLRRRAMPARPRSPGATARRRPAGCSPPWRRSPAQRRPEPVRVEPAAGRDLGRRAGSRPAGPDGCAAAPAGSRRGDDAAGDPEVRPDMFLVTNIFRDQLDRFGELYSMATDAGGRHRGAARVTPGRTQRRRPARGEPRPAGPRSAPVLRPPGGRRRHGGARARRGHDPLRALPAPADAHRVVHLSHLGDYECHGCGISRPDLDIAVTAVRASPDGGSEITVETPGRDRAGCMCPCRDCTTSITPPPRSPA